MIGRKVIAASVAVAAVAVGGVTGAVIGIPGLSGASSSPSSATTAQSSPADNGAPHAHRMFGRGIGARQDLLDAAAKALKLSTPDLLQKLSDGKTTIADVAKAQNVNLQDVIDAMDAVAKSDISNIVNNPFPMPEFPGKAFGGLKGGSGGSGAVGPAFPNAPMIGGFGFGFRGALGSSIDAVAKALGISSSDLRTDMRNGQSIADIAKAKHVNVDTLIGTLVADATSQIDAAVKAGHLPQAVATKLEDNLKQMITDAVNNSVANGFGFGFGPGRHGGRHGYGAGSMMPGAPSTPAQPPGPTN